jgi:hypothetical protein
VVNANNHKLRIMVIRHIGTGARHRMHTSKGAHFAQVGAQASIQLLHHLVGISLQLLGAVLGKFGNMAGLLPDIHRA